MFKRDIPAYKGLSKKDRQILNLPDPDGGIDQSREAQKGRKALDESLKRKDGGVKPEYAG